MTSDTLPQLAELTLRSQESPFAKSLLDILSLYPICDRLLSHLDIASLLPLKLLSRRLTYNIGAHLKKRWDINHRLSRFFTDPKGFRTELGSNDALISGSFALQFFDGVNWEESDLDIYVMDGGGAVRMGEYLHQREGYRLEKQEVEEDPYPETWILQTATYKRKIRDVESKVQLVITISTPIQAIMGGFYTTAVMNAISWNTAFSMFPLSTFIKRQTFIVRETIDQIDYEYREVNTAKYTSRGWTFIPLEKNDEAFTPSLPNRTHRHVGDSKTWVMPLDTTDIYPDSSTSIPDYVLTASHFCLTQSLSSELSLFVVCEPFTSHVLKHTYATSTISRATPDFWWAFIMEELDELTRAELRKLPQEERPAWFRRPIPPPWGLSGYSKRFEKGEGWTYYDERVPEWMERWKNRDVASV